MEEVPVLLKKPKSKKKRKPKKLFYATYTYIAPVKKFLNPFKVYRLFGDFILQEEFQYLSPKTSLLNKYKIITTVENDLSKKIITIKLEDNKSASSCAWQYLVSRMKSYGDANAKAWADAIETYCVGYLKMIEDLKDETKKKEFVAKMINETQTRFPQEFKDDLLSRYAVSISRYGQADDRAIITHISYNHAFFEMLGYDSNLMTTFFLKRGIFEIFPKQECTCAEWIKVMMKNYFPSELNAVGELEGSLLSRANFIKPVFIRPYVFYSLQENGEFCYELWLAMREDPDKMVAFSAIDDAYAGLEETIKNNEKEADDFFLRFYHQHYLGPFTNNDKICKVKQVEL